MDIQLHVSPSLHGVVVGWNFGGNTKRTNISRSWNCAEWCLEVHLSCEHARSNGLPLKMIEIKVLIARPKIHTQIKLDE